MISRVSDIIENTTRLLMDNPGEPNSNPKSNRKRKLRKLSQKQQKRLNKS
jgi:hypothetical protein